MEKTSNGFISIRSGVALVGALGIAFFGYTLLKPQEELLVDLPVEEAVKETVEAPLVWHEDFMAAREIAREQGRTLLVNFTGSDWCGPCIALEKNVFSQPAFLDYAAESLVLVKVDFPSRVEQSQELMERNERLSVAMNVNNRLPTIVLLDSKGVIIDKTGFMDVDSESYVQHLKELIAVEPTAVAEN